MAEHDRGTFDGLLHELLDRGGTELHLSAGSPPRLRLPSGLVALAAADRLDPEALEALLAEALGGPPVPEGTWAYGLEGRSRFRLSVFVQRGTPAAVCRALPPAPPTLEELGLPAGYAAAAEAEGGLDLVAGRAASGVSRTVAAVVDRINRSRPVHVMTVEDPVEVLHRHDVALVTQREVGSDVASVAEAVAQARHASPDVLVVGEVPSPPAVREVLDAAAAGLRVIAAVRATDTPAAVARVLEAFPAGERAWVRVRLAELLRAVYAQQLVPTVDGGHVPACEVLPVGDSVRTQVREGRGSSPLDLGLRQMLSEGHGGAVSVDAALGDLVRDGVVDFDVALQRCVSPPVFRRYARR